MRRLERFAVVLLVTSGLAVEASAGTITGQVIAVGVKDARDTVVYLGRIEGRSFPPSPQPAVIDQRNKEFIPRVVVILRGGRVTFLNSDALLHNIHAYRGRTPLFNQAMPSGAKAVTKTFPEPGEVVVLCNLHEEMVAYIVVVETPYADITDADGRYRLTNVPPGTYTLTTWHEKLKPVTQTVTLHGEASIEVNLALP